MTATELIPAVPATPAPTHPDAEFIRLFLDTKGSRSRHTRESYTFDVAKFLAQGNKPLNQVTISDVQAFLDSLATEGLKPSSQNRALFTVKSLLTFGQQTGYLQFNVGAAIRPRVVKDTTAERILTPDQVQRLIAALPPGRDRVILTILYQSGMRLSELCGLTWADAIARDAGGGQITVMGKGGKTRAILLRAAAWRELQSLRPAEAQPDDAIFDISNRTVERIVERAGIIAGIKVSPHYFRHSHATHAINGGAKLHVIQSTLGHGSIATTGRYLRVMPGESSSSFLPE